MHCPRCATEFSSGLKYCRSCGLDLRGVASIVEGRPREPRGDARHAMGCGVVFLVVGMAAAILNAMLATAINIPDKYGKVIFMAFLAIGMLLIGGGLAAGIAGVGRGRARRSKADDGDIGSGRTLDTAELDAQLPPSRAVPVENFAATPREAVGSVTEHTTRQLGEDTELP
jgi:hypothetical protein